MQKVDSARFTCVVLLVAESRIATRHDIKVNSSRLFVFPLSTHVVVCGGKVSCESLSSPSAPSQKSRSHYGSGYYFALFPTVSVH